MSDYSPPHIPILLIVGPPRSGTSILGRILGAHPAVSTWVEPYFVWDHFFRGAPHDERTAEDANPTVCSQIRGDFDNFRKGMGADIVADKSPRNCLRIPFTQQVFPEARYLFISRDGRDAVLSIQAQWKKKEAVFSGEGNRQERKLLNTILGKWLARRPLWRFRLRALGFELGPWHLRGRKALLNQVRWEGRFGWGPRFKGWQQMIDKLEPIQFYAHQWAACAREMIRDNPRIPAEQKFEMRYEDFVDRPEEILGRLLAFLELEPPAGFMADIPPIMKGNYGKWKSAFSSRELSTIGPILEAPLIEMGYEHESNWYA